MSTSTTQQALASVRLDELSDAAVDVVPVDRDWSEGYGDSWDYFKAPLCACCGTYARWIDYPEMLWGDRSLSQIEGLDIDSWQGWRCTNTSCDAFRWEIQIDLDIEPVMSYAYPFPRCLDERDSNLIAHLPLCIVRWDDGRSELALTAGGADLTWELCEAFILLGYLPPAHFALLPRVCGRGDLSSSGHHKTPDDGDKKIMRACAISACVMRDRAVNRCRSILRSIGEMMGDGA